MANGSLLCIGCDISIVMVDWISSFQNYIYYANLDQDVFVNSIIMHIIIEEFFE